MELFHPKSDRGEFELAAESFNEMLGSVDRLGEMIAEARRQASTADVRRRGMGRLVPLKPGTQSV
jgi:hypothetical protein